MLLDLLDRTLDLPIKSKIVMQPYVDFLARQYRLSHNGFHGIEHWLRVLITGRLIAVAMGADIEVLENFATPHDVMCGACRDLPIESKKLMTISFQTF